MIPEKLVTAVDKKTGHHVRVHPRTAAKDAARYRVIDADAYDVNGRLLPAKPNIKPRPQPAEAAEPRETDQKKEG